MNLSEQLSRIIEEKDILIDKYRKELEKFAIDFQSSSFDAIVKNVVSQLDTDNGTVLNTQKNIRLISELDSTINTLQKKQFPSLLKSLSGNFEKLSTLNNSYFGQVVGVNEVLTKATTRAIKTMALRLGLNSLGGLETNGWMYSLIKDRTVLDSVRQQVFKAVVGQAKFSDVLRDLKDYIQGTKEKGGAYEKYMKNSLYDIYQQYDAAYSQTMAKELDLKYFLYTGGLVKDSRDFCREHNNYIYTTEDAQGWAVWTPSKAIHIDTFEQKDIYAVPSYLGYPGYNPLIDRGGYNCRHQLAYITKGMAEKMGYKEKSE